VHLNLTSNGVQFSAGGNIYSMEEEDKIILSARRNLLKIWFHYLVYLKRE